MAQNPKNKTIPEGSVVRDDGCICPVSEEEETSKKCEKGSIKSCPYDPRFPNQNQTRHCYISFIDFQRCSRLLPGYPGCILFYRCYRALCPVEWTERWFEQMENGTFPRKIYPPKPIVRPSKKMKGLACVEDEEEEEPIC